MRVYDVQELLRSNSYPGRGIIIGRSADNRYAVAAYFIMGRSLNSRNRIFVKTDDGIRTQAYDPSAMVDPSLIIYNPVRTFRGNTIVTNGDQTDTIRDFMAANKDMRIALNTREFEPDKPNYTPRISAVINSEGSYTMSVIKSLMGNPECCCRYFYDYDSPVAGIGHFIHTYLTDGNPLPSFEGEPEPVMLDFESAESFASVLWDSLDENNKVSLFVRFIPVNGGDPETVIINKHI